MGDFDRQRKFTFPLPDELVYVGAWFDIYNDSGIHIGRGKVMRINDDGIHGNINFWIDPGKNVDLIISPFRSKRT